MLQDITPDREREEKEFEDDLKLHFKYNEQYHHLSFNEPYWKSCVDKIDLLLKSNK